MLLEAFDQISFYLDEMMKSLKSWILRTHLKFNLLILNAYSSMQ
jgi:hypothetical protein